MLVVALIAVFAAWSVAHVASAATMQLQMAAIAAEDHSMDMADCDGCDPGKLDGKDGSLCELVCLSPVVADLTVDQEVTASRVAVPHTAPPVHMPAGRTYPPDPLPPRSVLPI